MNRLENKVAWVTGSSRGIGRVVASHLASLGAKVAIHGTTPTSTRQLDEAESLDAVAEEIAAGHDADVLAVHGDLTRYGWPREVAKAVEFFVTSDSSYITGQVLRVDGGAQLWPA